MNVRDRMQEYLDYKGFEPVFITVCLLVCYVVCEFYGYYVGTTFLFIIFYPPISGICSY